MRVEGLNPTTSGLQPVVDPAPDKCLTLHVTFVNDKQREYPIHEGGDWSYREEPARLIVRPRGPKGRVRHEIPLVNVASVMIAPARIDGTGSAGG